MSAELWYLFLTTVLLIVLWIPHIVGQVINGGLLSREDYTKLREVDDYPDWVRRANRAHVNLVEQYGAFLGLVVVAHLAEISTGATVLAATVYFWARVAHAVVFITGVNILMARTLIFTVSFLALLVFAREIFAAY
jgi:uncharacterized MAPEG superfamily protein